MKLQPYGVQSSFAVNGSEGRCSIRSCIWRGRHFYIHDHYTGSILEQNLCQFHFRTGASPFSMEYEDADALLGVPKHKANGAILRGSQGRRLHKDPMLFGGLYTDSMWDGKRTTRIGFYRPSIKINLKSEKGTASEEPAAEVTVNNSAQPNDTTHWLDPVYNIFCEQGKGPSVYSLCGEKVLRCNVAREGKEPTCEVCNRVALYERVLKYVPQPAVELRPGIVTQPKPREHKPDFEEILLEGLMDDAAFANRKNWGERSGKAWNDTTQGVQRDTRLRWDRGGVNRKRG